MSLGFWGWGKWVLVLREWKLSTIDFRYAGNDVVDRKGASVRSEKSSMLIVTCLRRLEERPLQSDIGDRGDYVARGGKTGA